MLPWEGDTANTEDGPAAEEKAGTPAGEACSAGAVSEEDEASEPDNMDDDDAPTSGGFGELP